MIVRDKKVMVFGMYVLCSSYVYLCKLRKLLVIDKMICYDTVWSGIAIRNITEDMAEGINHEKNPKYNTIMRLRCGLKQPLRMIYSFMHLLTVVFIY